VITVVMFTAAVSSDVQSRQVCECAGVPITISLGVQSHWVC